MFFFHGMCMCFFLVHQFRFCASLFGCFPNNSSDANEWFGVQFKFSFNITKILIFILVKSTSCAFYALCLVGTFYAGCHLFLRLSNVHVRQAETLRSYSRTCPATTLCSDSTQLNAGGASNSFPSPIFTKFPPLMMLKFRRPTFLQ